MLQKLLIALVIASLSAVAGAETIYKWLDSSGQIHYTDLPPKQSGARLLGIYDHHVGDVDDEGNGYETGDDYDNGDPGDDTTTPSVAASFPQPPPSNEAVAAAAADAERVRVERCKLAQERYKQYTEARRLFRETDGQRIYLTDKELSDARASAKQSVDDYCS
ncbi:MAG TPA: DUF4124 domain-containing protein [Steroidobacteraceae bacterium]|nr:DUF4124 domain-containing protein [Steroidobacteraceae bacterium]